MLLLQDMHIYSASIHDGMSTKRDDYLNVYRYAVRQKRNLHSDFYMQLVLRYHRRKRNRSSILHFRHSAVIRQRKWLWYVVYLTFCNNLLFSSSQGYRYWSGINVVANCERALIWYKKVASKVSDEVKLTGGFAVQRIRLPDELENSQSSTSSSSNSIMDNNLLQYYRFLADKGDTQAQVG